MNKVLLSAALAGIFAAGVAATASAADAPKEKCYGITKAGKNDCKTTKHDCKGHGTGDASDWAFSDSKDACTKAGGKLEAPAAK